MTKKALIIKKLVAANDWVLKAKDEKDWTTYKEAVRYYTGLCKLLESCSEREGE